jgi:outer membrane receptor for ferrienterochelin and colicins
MKKLFALFILLQITHSYLFAQNTKVTGKVIDAVSHQPLAGATVNVKSTKISVLTDEKGAFELKLPKGDKATIVISFVGYADFSKVVAAGEKVEAALKTAFGRGDDIVVSASRRPEKVTNAPASVSVITAKDLAQTASFNIGELASKIQGVEFVRTGVTGVGFNARGFNNAFNAKVLQMTDGRNSMMAGGSGLPAGIMNTVIKEDVERLEIVLGPNSALYGPNAHNGIANTITKDPRKYQGTDIVLGVGNQEVFTQRLRSGIKFDNRWAMKLTGEFTSGKDFEFRDSVYNLGGGVYGPLTAGVERNPNFNFRHIRGSADLYYSINPKTDIIVSYGGSTNNFLSVNSVGRNQVRDWRFSYLQVRYVSPRFFAQVYETWTNVGTSYSIPSYTRDFYNRTHSTITDPANPLFPNFGYLEPDKAEANALRLGNMFKEKSTRLNAEAQYHYEFENAGVNIVASASYQKDKPNTFGTSLADANQTITQYQYGGALQVEKTLPANFKLVLAARQDHHSVFGNFFSPKAALVKGVPGGSIRVTYGQAYSVPLILFQYASLLGYAFGNGAGVNYIPNGADVTDPSKMNATNPLKAEQIATWELGYKGNIGKKLYVDINGYYGNTKNFLSPLIAVGGRAVSIGNVPVNHTVFNGTVNSSNLLSGATFFSYFNYGKVSAYGIDLGINYYFTTNISWAFKYSWFGSNIVNDSPDNDANKDGFVAADEKSLNAPQNRLATTLSFQNLAKGKMFLNVSARWVQAFDFYSGSQIAAVEGAGKRGVVYQGLNPITGVPRYSLRNFNAGALGGFTTFDLSLGYRFNSLLSLGGGISNLFDTKQREFVGSPAIGRLFSAELRVHIPNKLK